MPHALLHRNKEGELVIGPQHCTRDSAIASASPFESVAGIVEVFDEEVCAAAIAVSTPPNPRE